MKILDIADVAEFAIVLSREMSDTSIYRVSVAVAELIKHSRRIHLAQEQDCNGVPGADRRLESAERKAVAYIAELGLGASVGGDVRGPAIVIRTPKSGCSNAWGERGWCVPR